MIPYKPKIHTHCIEDEANEVLEIFTKQIEKISNKLDNSNKKQEYTNIITSLVYYNASLKVFFKDQLNSYYKWIDNIDEILDKKDLNEV